MEPSCSHTAGSLAKPKPMSFFPLRKLKGTQPTKIPVVQLAHLKEEAPDDEEGTDSEYPDGMTEEFMVHLTRAMKDPWQDEKCCYHCSSPDHFIRDCLLVKSARKELNLNCKETMVPKKEDWTPLGKVAPLKAPQNGIPKV